MSRAADQAPSATPVLAAPSPVGLVAVMPDQAGNLGAILRTAACLRAPVHVVEPCGFAFSPKAWRRSAMDYAGLAAIHRHASWAAFLAARGAARLVALTAHGQASLWEARFAPGDLLLLGSESAGLPAAALAAADLGLRIPLHPQARSLNIAVAGAIALAEAQRQLRA
ncbi:tRNA (cytidine(34)-2'-O)-methyltransferase [Paralimibaculum aggregatum]|uniref:tRNA (cytidine(34)-2'-O)-methyltransferase n=1 Tax=Paralimibaculum aggregatum TaxID=3036245 RepID=A0ABQ6LJV6_9RHOB|nr:TrmH family RNA methyltransferase [Limibaculum sp. NKW23]GMG82505.1 tRNA (cytidine(34)-2'-O)-methyltransferase [Limibaculum sp. NKW23]